MYEFWYDYVKPKHNEKAKLCYIDRDIFIVYIKTDDYIYIYIYIYICIYIYIYYLESGAYCIFWLDFFETFNSSILK